MKYAVTAHKYFETIHGEVIEEPVKQVNANSPQDAEDVARSLFKEDNYSSIYINYAHPEDASCYYNPIHGHESTGENWVSYLED